MIFDDVVTIIPNSWFVEEHNAQVNAISCAFYETLDTANCLWACEMSIANFTVSASYNMEL